MNYRLLRVIKGYQGEFLAGIKGYKGLIFAEIKGNKGLTFAEIKGYKGKSLTAIKGYRGKSLKSLIYPLIQPLMIINDPFYNPSPAPINPLTLRRGY